MAAHYIATRSILDLCEWSNRRLGEKVSQWWWEQTGIYLKGANKRAAEATTDSESESDSDSGGEE